MPPKKLPKLLIFDGNALIHRSFHALPVTMKTTSGEVVNAVYGFTSFLLRAIKEFKPDMVALALDMKGPTFRHTTYDKYKATRVKADPELYAQIPRAREVAEVLEIPVFQISGCEADDVIGTIVKKVGNTAEKIIVTGDMDTLQLIDDYTKIYTMSRGLTESLIYDKEQVRQRYGLEADQIIDYKALRGDPSDNIPGVKGIGEKTAVELLQEFKTIKNLYQHLKSETIKPRVRELLETYKDDAFMSHDLATIRRDIDFPFDQKKLHFGGFNRDLATKLFNELEFKSLLPRLIQTGVADKKAAALLSSARAEDKFTRNHTELKYEVITENKAFETFLKKLEKQKRFAFDTETSGLDAFTSSLLGLSFSWKEGEAYFISVNQPSLTGSHIKKGDLFSWQAKDKAPEIHPWLLKLKPILENKTVKKIAHNGKFDIKILKEFGIEVNGFDFDTMIAAYVLNPGNRQYSLDNLVLRWLNFEKISTEDLLGSGKSKLWYDTVPVERLGCYASEDADITFRLYGKLEPELIKQNLKKLFETIEIPLTACLIDMERAGISLDTVYLKKLEKELDTQIASIEKKVWKLCGKNFNLSSPKQLQEILFTDLNISSLGLSKTKTGISTGADELAKLKGKHEIIDLILEYREVTKLASTYVRTLPELINPVTGRLHTSFNQTIAATGRLSSIDPNLQNIPIRTELGRKIRAAFIAKPGYELLSLDYSQLELRIAAHIANDPMLKKAFKDGEDVHTATAALINHVPITKVTADMRRQAKTINFGILYGQGPHGLAQTADISYEEARNFIDEYFKVYKNIKKYVDETITGAQKKGYVETLFGRKRYLEEINATNAMIRKSAERMAVNTPIQGTEADMIKAAMIKVKELIDKEYQGRVTLLLQVHDELVFEIDPKIIKEITPKIQKIMEGVIKLSVPIIVDGKHGKNWIDMKPV